MIKNRCSTCKYGELHDYLDRYYCRNKDCVNSHFLDREEEYNCKHWIDKQENNSQDSN